MRKKNTVLLVLLLLFLTGILFCALALSIAFYPPSISIRSNPEGATIYINCINKRKKTPANLLMFLETYRVMVSKKGYQPKSEDVEISFFNRSANLDFDLEKETLISGDKNIHLEKPDTKRYPEITLTLKMKGADGAPITGLKKEHIALLETSEEVCLETQPQFHLRELSKADIIFFIDTTSSMTSALDVAKKNIETFCDLLATQNIEFRLAGYSFDDKVPYKSKYPFKSGETGTAATTHFKKWLSGLKAAGGGDGYENCLDSIIDAGNGGLIFRPDVQKVGILITDTGAHVAGDGGNSATTATYEKAKEALASAGIRLYASSPHHEYRPRLKAKNLGWPFSSTVLTGKFLDECIGWYVMRFIDSITREKKAARRFKMTVKSPPEHPKEYIKNFIIYPGRN